MAERNVNTAEKLPEGQHWVILQFDQYYSDDGYSESEGGGNYAHHFVHYYAYDTEEEWKRELHRLFKKEPGRKDIRALTGVKPVPLTIGLNIGP